MQLKGQELIPLGQDRIWNALNDPEVLKACIPGCETLEGTPEAYRIVMLAAVGPVRARFNGKLSLTDVRPRSAYTLVFEGSGGVAGFGKGRAEVSLHEVPGGTQLTYSAAAQVGGKIAQVGSRLIDGVAARMAAEFFTRFKVRVAPAVEAESSASAPASSPDADAGASLWSRLAFWRRWRRTPVTASRYEPRVP